jgi:hypothetical protein
VNFVDLNSGVTFTGAATNLLSGRSLVTIAFWANHRTSLTGVDRFFTTGATEEIIALDNVASGGFQFQVGATPIIAGAVTLATWIHWICVADGTNLNVYQNGLLFGTPPAFSSTVGSCADFYIGNRAAGDRQFDGLITDFRIYSDRALTADQAYQLYVASKTGYKRELNWVDEIDGLVIQAAAAANTKRSYAIFID